jgi:hypothetical protein
VDEALESVLAGLGRVERLAQVVSLQELLLEADLQRQLPHEKSLAAHKEHGLL